MDKIEPIAIVQNVNDVHVNSTKTITIEKEIVEGNSTMTKFFTLE